MLNFFLFYCYSKVVV